MSARSTTPAGTAGTNVVVLRGHLSSPPRTRDLASGDRLVTLEVTARVDGGPAESVPVAWFEAPDPLPAWEAGQEVVVVGRIRRRFFKAGPATASRTEVLAGAVLAGGRRAAIGKAVAGALATISAAGDP
jgi:single-strand DNA-binding protein